MKKNVTYAMLIMALTFGFSANTYAVNPDRGGFMGFIAGCCFGVRNGAAYNDGKEIHWRQWVMLVPVANIVFAIWSGIDGANGMTTEDYAKQYGSIYY